METALNNTLKVLDFKIEKLEILDQSMDFNGGIGMLNIKQCMQSIKIFKIKNGKELINLIGLLNK